MKLSLSHHKISRFLVASFLFVFVVAVGFGASAAPAVITITVPENRAEIIDVPSSFSEVNIADKSIARVIKHSSKKVSIVGKRQGKTQIDLVNSNGKGVWRANVIVTYDVPAVKMAIRKFFPAEAVEVQLNNDAIVLSGAVTDAEIGHRVEQLAKQFAGGDGEPVNVINLMQIRTGQQVMLRVRIGELQRGNIDIGTQGITGDVSVFDKMLKNGTARLLAEPSLVAISGESAEFLSGGELPIPVRMKHGQIDYKEYGVSVKFTPYVLSQNRIRLTVEPSVSELSSIGSVKIDGGVIPGITTRRAKTTVELAPGESFMVAGLIKDDMRGNIDSVEGGENGIGALFKGNNITHTESELVIAVTPYLVDPVVSGNIKLPTDISNVVSKLGRNFENSLGDSRKSAKGLEGSHGQMAE